jgi:hypothetical protein
MMELSGFLKGSEIAVQSMHGIYCHTKSLGLFYNKGKTPPVLVDIAVEDRTVSLLTSVSLNLTPAKIIPKKVKPTHDT